MKYNPKIHLLRPLEEGELIQTDDIEQTTIKNNRFNRTILVGNRYDTVKHMPHFRPVPITTGWHPRSEAAEAFSGMRPTDLVIVCYSTGITVHCVATAEKQARWHAFYIIPPCDLPPPDPERERFDRWWKLCAPENMDTADDKETAYCIWLAARREAV